MDLIPVDPNAGNLEENQVALTTEAMALAEIQTTEVVRGEASMALRIVGKLNWDETRFETVTAWAGGRLDSMQISYEGELVQEGQSVAVIWSPELISAQQEYLESIKAAQRLRKAPGDSLKRTARETVESALSRLIALGMNKEDVEALQYAGGAQEQATLYANVSGVSVEVFAEEGEWVKRGQRLFSVADPKHLWAELEAHESDLAFLETGQEVSLEADALPGMAFMGKISFIEPTLDLRTRTVMVRVQIENKKGLLKPGMFIRGVVNAALDSNGQVTRSTARPLPLLIPRTAPLMTGTRAVVYLKVLTEEKTIFEGREILLGPRAGEHYVVLDGLEEGEIIVTRGAFKLDSSLQILAKPSMMSMGSEIADMSLDVPQAFQEALSRIATPYLAIRVALANDDFDTASKEVAGFLSELESASSLELSETITELWSPLAAKMNNGGLGMKNSKGIEDLRASFEHASKGLIAALDRFGYVDGGPELKVFFCPMAFENTGAEWLQIEDRLANPYFGASMLRCGEMRRVIDPLSSEQNQDY
jgi:Cu(I)/Ag(I) efflux system membrane fusion protein